MPPILDLAIGLVFVFLVFSLVVSALNEFWLTFLDQRSKFLQEGLRELLHDVDGGQWVKQICEHGLVDALSKARGDKSRPAYIGAESFTAAILDLISPAKPESARKIDEIRTGIANLGATNPKLKESLTALLDQAGGDLSKFKDCIGKWYDRSMDRVTGWYKRCAQKWLLVLGFLVAVFCNVDSIRIIGALSSDPTLLQSTVNQAIATAKANPNGIATDAETKTIEGLIDKTDDAMKQLEAVKVPIGWTTSQYNTLHQPGGGLLGGWHWGPVFGALIGWWITALAASLGAPFWFDTLNRFINIRGNGRAPGEKDPTKTKDPNS